MIIASTASLYSALNHWWKIKGNAVLYILIKTSSLHDFVRQHWLKFQINIPLSVCESMILHAERNYFKSPSEEAVLQETGLKSACGWLVFIPPGMPHTQQPASPSAGNSCVHQQVELNFHMFQTLMRFGFDFLFLGGRGGNLMGVGGQ